MGGERKFVDKLQSVFDKENYDPANEPDIAYPYLFTYFPKEAWRTQRITSKLLGLYYRNEPSGIPGNDDTGAMSAWGYLLDAWLLSRLPWIDELRAYYAYF